MWPSLWCSHSPSFCPSSVTHSTDLFGKLHSVFLWASETSNCFWLASLVFWRGLVNNFEWLNCPKKLVQVNFSKVAFLEMWLDLGNHLHLQRHIYERSEFSVQLDWGFIHTMWQMGSWKWEGTLFLELFSQDLWNSKGQIIYCLYPAPAFFFVFFPPFFLFFSNFLISQKWRIFAGKLHLALKKHKFSNKQFAITALPSLPRLPEYPFDIPEDLQQSCWCRVVVEVVACA